MDIVYVIFLGIAVSLDSFIAGAAYGIKKITLPLSSLSIVGIVTVVCTGVAMILAQSIGKFIDIHIATVIGSLLLFLIGLWNIFQEYLTKDIVSCQVPVQKLSIRIGRLIISIMANPEAVDTDHSQSISPSEAVFLGLALGIDNMTATFAASLLGVLPFYTPFIMGLIQMLLIVSGIQASTYCIPQTLKNKFPYLSGSLLVIIGLLRLVK